MGEEYSGLTEKEWEFFDAICDAPTLEDALVVLNSAKAKEVFQGGGERHTADSNALVSRVDFEEIAELCRIRGKLFPIIITEKEMDERKKAGFSIKNYTTHKDALRRYRASFRNGSEK